MAARTVLGIVGARTYTDTEAFAEHMESVLKDLELTADKIDAVVSGGAAGADTLAAAWAEDQGIALVEHKPQGNHRGAFLARNTLIARDCTVLVAFPSETSRGTYHTVSEATKMGKRVVLIRI